MCTSIVMESLDGKHFLSRTMDFGFDLEATPSLCPRKYHWKSATDGSEFIGDYYLLMV
ncbi:MAG: linear amide C-N hydrolase [Carnobacterium sp.]